MVRITRRPMAREEDRLLEEWASGRFRDRGSASRNMLSRVSSTGLRFLFVALGLLATGFYITAKSDRHSVREEARQEYEKGVLLWEEIERQRFASTAWSIRFNDTEAELHTNRTEGFVVQKHLPPHTRMIATLSGLYSRLLSPEDRRQVASWPEHGRRRDTWRQSLQTEGSGTLPGAPENDTLREVLVPLPVRLKSQKDVEIMLVARQGNAPPTLLRLGSYPIARSELRATGNWKNCKYRLHGTYTSGKRCALVDVLHRLCIRVEFFPLTSRWRLATDSNVPGACPSKRSLAAYVKLTRPSRKPNSTLPVIPKSIRSSSTVVVRSSRDPEFLAEELVHKYHMEHENESFLVAGNVCIILGVVALIPACVLLAAKGFNSDSEDAQ